MIPCACGRLGRAAPETEAAATQIGTRLGFPGRRMILQSSGRAAVFRSLWTCGCSVDFVDAEQPRLFYGSCAAHRGFGERLTVRGGVIAYAAEAPPPCDVISAG